MHEELDIFYRFGVALAIGLMIGVERGWQNRRAKTGRRIAGVRTHALIGLLGATIALLSEQFGAAVIALAFLGFVGLLTAVYVTNILRSNKKKVGITSLIAEILTFALGALVVIGDIAIAATAAVATTLLLSCKNTLHRWINTLEYRELMALIKLLVISVALLSILPNQGYGPWQVLNPYAIWWMVVLIATISFIGYFAVKIKGANNGIMYTGLFGGLVASTAVALSFARLARINFNLSTTLANGILLACGTMYLRMLMVGTLVNPDIFIILMFPTMLMASITYLPAILFFRQKRGDGAVQANIINNNPLELKAALGFGLLLALIMLLSKALQHWFGGSGILTLSVVSGVADVDAITLTLANMGRHDLSLNMAATGIILAATVNSIVKTCICAVAGNRQLGLRVGIPLILGSSCGLLCIWIMF